MFCLVRTDPAAPKHEGITFLLVDMTTPGIAVRPILLISGASPFCETEFDGVRVPARNVVGTPGKGWEVAKAVLESRARAHLVRAGRALDPGDAVEDVARAHGALEDPVVRGPDRAARDRRVASSLTVKRASRARHRTKGVHRRSPH